MCLDNITAGKRSMDAELAEDLEELLITSDVGVQTTLSLMDRISTWQSAFKKPHRGDGALATASQSSPMAWLGSRRNGFAG